MKDQFAAPAEQRKLRREKTPSDLGEEVLAIALKGDAGPSIQRQTAPGSTTAGDTPASSAPASSKATAGTAGEGAASYSSAARQSANVTSYSSPAAAKPTVSKREKTPGELGDEVVARVLVEEGLMDPKALEEYIANIEEPSAQTLANAGLDGGTIQAVQLGDTLSRMGLKGETILRATDAGQAQIAAQNLTNAGLDGNAQLGLQWGGDFSQALDNSHLAPGTSPLAYGAESVLSGALKTVNNEWNGLVDHAMPFAQADVYRQMLENEQNAMLGNVLLGDTYQQYADLQNARLQETMDRLPEGAETLRWYGADAYAQSIRDRYDPQGLYVPTGELLSGVGQGLTQMGTKALFQQIPADGSVITDAIRKVYPDVFQYLGTAGSTAQKAREAGASDDQALLAGAFSGGKGYLNKHFYGGIPGLKESTVDNMIFPLADTDQERVLLKGVSDIIGGGVRSILNTEEDALISKLWNDDDRSIGQTLWETLPQAWHSALINTATNNVLHPLDLVKNYQDAGIVDAAMDTMRNGGTLSDAQLAEAEAALDRLEGNGNNGWVNLPRNEWEAVKNADLTK